MSTEMLPHTPGWMVAPRRLGERDTDAAAGNHRHRQYTLAANVSVANTVAETTVLTDQIPARSLRTNQVLEVVLGLSFLNNTGADRSTVVTVSYGGTVAAIFTTGALATNAAARALDLRVCIASAGSSTTQRAWGTLAVGGVGSAAAPPTAVAGAAVHVSANTALTIDSTLEKELKVTVTQSNNDTTVTGLAGGHIRRI